MTDLPRAQTVSFSEHPNGIFYRLIVALQVSKPGKEGVLACVILFICLTFLPLVLLASFNSAVFTGVVEIPLLQDYATLTRFLIVGPIILSAELLIKPVMSKVAQQFVECKVIDEAQVSAYETVVHDSFRLRDSLMAEILLLVLAFVFSIAGAQVVVFSHLSNWQAVVINHDQVLTWAGYWNLFVSQPLFKFVLFDWIYEYILWVVFLARVARFKLNIVASHPDGAGGLGFISIGQSHYCLTAFALSAALAGVIAQYIMFNKAPLHSFMDMGIVWILFMLVVFLGPLLIFSPALYAAKREALFKYGKLAQECAMRFEKKWLSDDPTLEPGSLIEASDASVLADFNSDFQQIRSMRTIVCSKNLAFGFALVSALPAIPLVLSVMPVDDLIAAALKAVN